MSKPKPKWTLSKFFERWYVGQATTTRSRKPAGDKTIASRRVGVRYWTELMATKKRPEGPRLNEITVDHLEQFRDRLRTVTYQRHTNSAERQLSESTQFARFTDVVILLSAAGPIDGNRIRAGVLESVPRLYHQGPVHFPKETWTLDEMRQVAESIDTFETKTDNIDRYRDLARAWLALLFYSGHRASTYKVIGSDDLVETRPDAWFIDIKKSVKTGKADRVAVHPQLLELLKRCGEGSPIINWPFGYRRLYDHFKAWQIHAGLPENRIFGPQAMRRLNAQVMLSLGVDQAQAAASNSLGHSSVSMTAGHYADAKNTFRLMMPDLFVGASIAG